MATAALRAEIVTTECRSRLDAVATEHAPTLLPVPLKAEVGAGTGGARAKTLVVGGSGVGLRYAANGYRP